MPAEKRRMKARCRLLLGLALASAMTVLSLPAAAHDPVFGLGPHTLFKHGTELHAGLQRSEAGAESETEYAVALKYGVTANLVVGVEMPYLDLESGSGSGSGRGNARLTSKYRFWRDDRPGVQESAAFALVAVLDTADVNGPRGATDWISGLSYGYEGRRWYRWASVRYRHNGRNDGSLERGDRLRVDLVGGIRFRPTGYREPDWVWMLELNGEFGERASFGGSELANSGGSSWFASPGLMWTLRNVAIKTGVQVPIIDNLNGDQLGADYRATLEVEVHY